jgi:predicted CopG family antitoxin
MVKTITIKESVYNELIKVKEADESFSDLFERLLKKTIAISVLEKLKGSIDFKEGEKEKILSDIYSKREVWR